MCVCVCLGRWVGVCMCIHAYTLICSSKRYISSVPKIVLSMFFLNLLLDCYCKQSDDVIVESEESGEDGDEVPEETIQKLKALKAELSRKVEDQERDRNTIQVSSWKLHVPISIAFDICEVYNHLTAEFTIFCVFYVK